MSARKPATRIVEISQNNIDDLLEVALENFFRATKVLKPSDIVDRIFTNYTPPWKDDRPIEVVIKLITPVRIRKKEVEHIVYNVP